MILTPSPLLTDLYQLTMLQGYFDSDMEEEAVFEFFIRRVPSSRSFLVAAGLEQVLDYLETLRFHDDDVEYLRRDGRFHSRFLDYLADFRFTGYIHAIPEGTVFFPDEPIIRVTAPLPQAQFVESRIINLLQFQTLIASKAARMTLAAPDKTLMDFGLRRAHGAEAGLLAARASYLGGFSGSATVLAGKLFGIPTFGTMAHSFIQAHDSEISAFYNFSKSQPHNTTLLIDTYDTEDGAKKVVQLAQVLKKKEIEINGVRLDSGDMISLSKRVRKILDNGGLQEAKIFASGSLDEVSLADFIREEAPVDGFGIGTKMTTSSDAPYLDCAYKLVEYGGIGRRKLSEGKATWPGRKQVYRTYNGDAKMAGDILTLASDHSDAEPLLTKVMAKGARLTASPPLPEVQTVLLDQLNCLPSYLKDLDSDIARSYPLEISESLQTFSKEVDRRMKEVEEQDKHF